MNTPVHILYLEADDVDRRAFLRLIGEKQLPYEVTVAPSLAEARARLAAARFDVILAACHLPDGDCTELFEEVRDIPFILLADRQQEPFALRMLERGADDYLPKEPRQHHLEALPFALEKTRHRQLLREKEQRLSRELQASERNLRMQLELITLSHEAIVVRRLGGEIVSWNRGAEQMYGWTAQEAVGRSSHQLLQTRHGDAVAAGELIDQVLAQEGKWEGELHHRCRDGMEIIVDSRQVMSAPEAGAQLVLEANRDITVRRQALAALREAKAANEASLAQLEAVLNSMTEALVIATLDGTIVTMNPAALRLHGFISAEEACRHLTDYPRTFEVSDLAGRLLPTEVWPIARAMREVFFDFVLRVRRRDTGREFIGSYSGSPVRDPSGKLILAITTIRDITEQKRAENELRLQSAALQAAANAIVITDVNGAIQWVNPAFERLTGYSAAEVRGRNSRLLKSGQHPPAFFKQMWETILAGQSWRGELVNRRKDGSLYTEEMTITPVLDAGARVAHFVAIKQDITEIVRAREVLARNRQELELLVQERTAEMEQMSYSMIHDLRAPLRAIQSFGGILEEDPQSRLSEEGRDLLAKMRAAATRMDRLIVDVLNYSKVVRGQLPLEPVDVTNLAREIVGTYPNLRPPRAEVWIEPNIPPVQANEAALTQCLSQLLSNAVKFVGPGVQPRIRIWAQRVDRGELIADRPPPPGYQPSTINHQFVRLWVEDNGIGIPPHLHHKLFGIFQRLSHRGEGTGMGLAIVRKAVERMGGTVGVESEPGKGSRFWLQLPAAQA